MIFDKQEDNHDGSLQFLKKITDLNPHQIYSKSKEGKYTFVNQQFAKSVGLTKEEIVGKSDFEIGLQKDVALRIISDDIQVMDSGVPSELYEELTDANGSKKFVHAIRSPFKNEEGETIGILGLGMDRSAEKKQEKDLIASKLRYQALFDNLNDAVIIYDFENEKISSLNKAALQMFKFSENEDLSKYNRFDVFPERVKDVNVHDLLANHKEMILASKPIKGEAVMKRLDGELFQCKISVYPTPEKNADGIIVIQDVSLEKQAKKEILRSKNYFMQIYENSPVAISLTDLETMQVANINGTHSKVFGYNEEEIASLNIEELIPAFNLENELKMLEPLISKQIDKRVIEKEYKTKDGKKLYTKASQCVIKREGKEYLLEFIEDITNDKQQDERYKFLFENAFDGIAVTDGETRNLIYCNSKFEEFFDLGGSYNLADFRTLDFSPHFQDNGLASAEYRKQLIDDVSNEMNNGVKEFCWKFQLKNGDTKYADVTLLRRRIGNENHIYSIYRNTTNERMIQNALRESEKRFRLIFDNAFDGLYFFNYKTQKLVLANSRLFELFETSPDRILIDKPHLKPDVQPDGQRTIDKIHKALTETLEKGKSRANRIFKKSDGSTVHLEISTFLLSPPDDDIIVSIYKDISDQKRAEDALVVNATQEEKLDALGRELSSYTLFSTQKNKLLQELSDDLKILIALEPVESKIMADKIRRKIANNLDEKENWISFKVQFERVHPRFFSTLESTYAELTTNDLKHCAYVKMGLSNAEIADILFVGKKAVEMSHYRLKKKLKLPKSVSLKQAMHAIETPSVAG